MIPIEKDKNSSLFDTQSTNQYSVLNLKLSLESQINFIDKLLKKHLSHTIIRLCIFCSCTNLIGKTYI